MNIGDINNFFGDVDMDLLDQILKGSFEDCESIVEIGCGQGRNLIYFLRQGFQVHGVDNDKSALQLARYIATELGAGENSKFHHNDAIVLPLENTMADAVINCRVFHFAANEKAFLQMWHEQSRILKPGGMLFFSMDSIVGIRIDVDTLADGKVRFQDESIRFVLTEQILDALEIDRDFEWLEPLKMINYNGQHSQAIMVLQKK